MLELTVAFDQVLGIGRHDQQRLQALALQQRRQVSLLA
jgi:hypothetical protein